MVRAKIETSFLNRVSRVIKFTVTESLTNSVLMTEMMQWSNINLTVLGTNLEEVIIIVALVDAIKFDCINKIVKLIEIDH